MQKRNSRTGAKASPNPLKKSRAAAQDKKHRTSVGNAKARSQRSVGNAEKRSTGVTELAGRSHQNSIARKPRSQRLHSGKARRHQGVTIMSSK
jgi:hypothetical protein